MNTVNTTYRHSLYKGSKKWRCPGCGHNTAVLYVDNETKEFLPDQVCRCDRENRCGYHFTPKQYFAENGRVNVVKSYKPAKSEAPKPIDFLPSEYLAVIIDKKFRNRNNFYKFLSSLFSEPIASQLFKKYLLATSGYWKGACVFPQIDTEGNVRQIKIMLHDAYTGKRVKEGATVERWDGETKSHKTVVTENSCSLIYGRFINESTRHLNLQQVFFGTHLLREYPNTDVCIVESEKTALIASIYLPQFIWLATGGASGCRWRDYSVFKLLKGRNVTFFPDHGYFNRKSGKTCYQEWKERCERIKDTLGFDTRIKVSDLLEKRLPNTERNDQDIADLLVIRDEPTGIALTEQGYPVIWDYEIKTA